MIQKKKRESVEVNASSMADIAFLLLIFFLVTTTIASDKGLSIRLPPKNDEQVEIKLKERNIFNVLVNSNNQLLVEEQPMKVEKLKTAAKEFIMNNGRGRKIVRKSGKSDYFFENRPRYRLRNLRSGDGRTQTCV